MKPEIKVIKIKRGEWKVQFWIGVQGFTLQLRGTKEEATWTAKMLKGAFKNITPNK